MKTTSPKNATLAVVVEQPATVQAFETTPIIAKLPGYVTKVLVDIGDDVAPEQLLAEIAIPELGREAEQKKAMSELAAADVTLAERNVDVAKAQVLAAGAAVDAAKAGLIRTQGDFVRWESELKRVEGLVASKVLDTQTLDEARRQHESAAASKDEMAAKVVSAAQSVVEAKARVGRADAEVAAAVAKKNLALADAARVAALLEYTRVRSPYFGVVTARFVHTGHFLQPGSGNRFEPLFTVARIETVRVFLDVPEASADKAVVGAKATVRVPALANREFSGTITRTSRVLNPDSRTLRAEIDLPNPDGALRPGTYAVARIATTVVDAMTLPSAAVLFADETAYCYLVQEGKAVKLRVQVGRSDNGTLQIIGAKPAAGAMSDWKPFTGSERIVVGNLGALADGQPVTE